MPTNLVRSKQDEADWAEARRIVDKQYPDKSPDDKDKSYWKLTTSIYENIKKNRGKKKMQKQASVGGILAEQIHLRKTAAGDDRQYTVFLRDWIAEQYKNGRDPVEEMRRISQQQPAGIQQPSDQPHTVQPMQPSGAPVVPANPAVQRVPARGQLNNAVQKKQEYRQANRVNSPVATLEYQQGRSVSRPPATLGYIPDVTSLRANAPKDTKRTADMFKVLPNSNGNLIRQFK